MPAGHLGDRVGRRTTLVATVVLIGAAAGGIGLLPTYDTIDFWAPSCWPSRASSKGCRWSEWSGAVLTAVGHAPRDRRALHGAMPQLGPSIGPVASSAAAGLAPRRDEPLAPATGHAPAGSPVATVVNVPA